MKAQISAKNIALKINEIGEGIQKVLNLVNGDKHLTLSFIQGEMLRWDAANDPVTALATVQYVQQNSELTNTEILSLTKDEGIKISLLDFAKENNIGEFVIDFFGCSLDLDYYNLIKIEDYEK